MKINLVLHSQKYEDFRWKDFSGLYIDECLTWRNHVDCLARKLAPIVGILYRFRSFKLPHRIKLNLYYSLFHPHITYLNVIWSVSATVNIKRIEILQRRALKHIYDLHPLTPTDLLYNITNVFSVGESARYCSAQYIHKTLLGDAHSNLVLTKINQMHNYSTRHREGIYIAPVSSVKYGLKSPL